MKREMKWNEMVALLAGWWWCCRDLHLQKLSGGGRNNNVVSLRHPLLFHSFIHSFFRWYITSTTFNFSTSFTTSNSSLPTTIALSGCVASLTLNSEAAVCDSVGSLVDLAQTLRLRWLSKPPSTGQPHCPFPVVPSATTAGIQLTVAMADWLPVRGGDGEERRGGPNNGPGRHSIFGYTFIIISLVTKHNYNYFCCSCTIV